MDNIYELDKKYLPERSKSDELKINGTHPIFLGN